MKMDINLQSIYENEEIGYNYESDKYYTSDYDIRPN